MKVTEVYHQIPRGNRKEYGVQKKQERSNVATNKGKTDRASNQREVELDRRSRTY